MRVSKLVHTFREGIGGSLAGAALSPDGKTVALLPPTDTHFSTIYILKDNGEEIRSIADPRLGLSVRSLAFSNDGNTLVAGFNSGPNPIKQWSLETGEVLASPVKIQQPMRLEGFSSHDGKVVKIGLSDNTRVILLRGGEEEKVIHQGSGSVTSVRFSPDGDRVLFADLSGKLRIYDLANDSDTWIFPTKVREDAPPFVKVRFSPDGEMVAAADENGDVHVIKIGEDWARAILPGDETKLKILAYSPKGDRIVTVPSNGRPRLWEIHPDPSDFIGTARNLAPRELTPNERIELYLEE